MNILISDTVDVKAARDIKELDEKIRQFRNGQINEESFRLFRLARGIYGQRQSGVNMIRIKLPFGRVSPEQLKRISEIAVRYGSGNLHATTRQDIQLHYVKLNTAPQLWADLEEKDITLREACGNTIRNLTASPYAGIDPDEPFDVSPYANAMFKYFLRNPICQNLGRKFKIAFSSSEKDAAFTFIHDLGFIPRIKEENGNIQRGFKVLLAGGLGAQPFVAHPIFDFMEDREIIPFTEACLRIFDRYGERANRHKARLKYLINDIGVEAFLQLVKDEREAVSLKSYSININDFYKTEIPVYEPLEQELPDDAEKYAAWYRKNLFVQKQKEFFAVRIKITTGDLHADTAAALSEVAARFASSDMRITANQGILLKYVYPEYLPNLFNALNKIGLAEPGFDSIHDITACPGTDTCNLGIASSMGLARELEKFLKENYPDVAYEHDIKIKISGCMNGCAHHSIANIGFHGMSMKVGAYILPAMQVLLGGGVNAQGEGTMAEKIIKLPAKAVPNAVAALLDDFENNAEKGQRFNDYYSAKGKMYFYNLLKPLGEIGEVTQFYLTDWGNEDAYKVKIGVGECAVPMIDMVSVVLDETKQTLSLAKESIENGEWVDAIYYSYTALINTAKALLMTKEIASNTQYSVLKNFDPNFVENGEFSLPQSFADMTLEINKHQPKEAFARDYYTQSFAFYESAVVHRLKQLQA